MEENYWVTVFLTESFRAVPPLPPGSLQSREPHREGVSLFRDVWLCLCSETGHVMPWLLCHCDAQPRAFVPMPC